MQPAFKSYLARKEYRDTSNLTDSSLLPKHLSRLTGPVEWIGWT